MNMPAQGLPPERDLVRSHADLVKRIAYHLAARLPSSVDVEDLIQSGMMGLLDAARHFKSDQGASFETYAGIRIRGAMVDELRRGDWAPRSVHRRLREISQTMREIEQATGREAKDSEVAAKLNLPLAEYHSAVADAARCQVLSMDAHEGDEDSGDEQFRVRLAEGIAALPEREQLVMSLYYTDELNLREIGQALGVSESRVCQMHGQALLRLRARMKEWSEVTS